MIRRPMWLAAGAALGVGGTMWTRRRLERLSRRVRPTAVATELASMAERTRRGAVDKVRDAARHGADRGPASTGRPVARPVGPRPFAALSVGPGAEFAGRRPDRGASAPRAGEGGR